MQRVACQEEAPGNLLGVSKEIDISLGRRRLASALCTPTLDMIPVVCTVSLEQVQEATGVDEPHGRSNSKPIFRAGLRPTTSD